MEGLPTAPRTALTRPPGPKSVRPFLGVLPHFRKDPAGYLLSVAREYGDLAHMRLGSQHAYVVSHPDWIRDILVMHQANFTKSRVLQRAKVLLGDGLLTSEGEFHTRQRRLVQPAFHRDRLVRYAADMVACAEQARVQWQPGVEIDMHREMTRLTLAIVGRTLFSADVSSNADEIGAAMTHILALFDTLLVPFSDWLQKLPIPSVRRFRKAQAQLDRIVYGLIAERRASHRDTGDLLSMLLLADDGEAGDAGDGHAGMTDQQVHDEALTLLVAGHETTANALTWTWYLLSQNPDVEARMHAELDRVLGGHSPTFDDVPRLPYITGVFAESLRLFPPAWAIGRRALQDYSIGGYTIPAKSILLMSPWVVHRDPRWWGDQPERVDPARWTPAASEKRPKFAFFPFGGGPRICIGERFAWAEGVLVLATLAQHWKMRLVPCHPVATQAVITLRPRYGMKMTLERRTV